MSPSSLVQAWRNLKIKHKLSFTFLVVVVVPIVIIQYFTLGALRAGMESQQEKQLEYIKNNVSNVLEEYRVKLQNYASFLITNQSLADLAFIASLTSDSSRLTDELSRYLDMLDVDRLEVIGTDNRIVAGVGVGTIKTENATTSSVVRRAVSGTLNSGIVEERGSYYIQSAGPIVRDDETIAVLSSSILLGGRLADDLRERTGSEISFEFDGKIVASSFKEASSISSLTEKDGRASGIQLIDVAGISYASTSQIIQNSGQEEIGRIHIASHRKDIVDAKTEFIWMLIGVTVLSLVIAQVMGYQISRYFAAQLSQGVEFAQSVARGNLMEQISIRSQDEIGVLGLSLNNMVADLRSTVNNIQVASSRILEATGSIDAEHLEKGSNRQAESLELTMTSMSQMSASIKSVAQAAEGLSSSSAESSSSILEMTSSIEQVASSSHSLSSIVELTSSSIEKMVNSVNEIIENVNRLSQTATETSSTVSQFGASIRGIRENAAESAALSEKVSKQANDLGNGELRKMIEGITRIQQTIVKSSEVIHRLGDRSSQVGKVVTVIDNVTRQTNLLALNAAILASQAGEHGRSFSVVAEEIKGLADRTSASTKEIAQLIATVQSEVNDAMVTIQEGSETISEGVQISQQAREALMEMLESSTKSSEMAHAIKLSTVEQSQGIQNINQATLHTSGMVQEIAEATDGHRREADQIIKVVGDLKNISNQIRKATIQQAEGSRLINKVVEEVNAEAQGIAKATREQGAGSEQIVSAVGEMTGITQQNLSMASEVRQAIELLTRQAELLQKEVKRFVV